MGSAPRQFHDEGRREEYGKQDERGCSSFNADPPTEPRSGQSNTETLEARSLGIANSQGSLVRAPGADVLVAVGSTKALSRLRPDGDATLERWRQRDSSETQERRDLRDASARLRGSNCLPSRITATLTASAGKKGDAPSWKWIFFVVMKPHRSALDSSRPGPSLTKM